MLALLLTAQPAVRVEAETSVYESRDRTFILEGDVAVTRDASDDYDSITLRADRIEGKIDGLIQASGEVAVTTGGITAYAARGEYDLATSTGEFEDVRSQTGAWLISAERIAITGPERYIIEECRITSCDEHPPHYHFRVGRAKFEDGRVSMWGPRMVIGKVPVLWLPYLTFVPGRPRPPVRIRAGKSDYEGYFLKLSYLYHNRFLGEGDLKLDWRSHRGWAYGVTNDRALPGGNISSDLYRVDERARGGRGVARFRYTQDYSNRVRGLGEIYYLTDRNFLQDYRFDNFVREPDPQSHGSITYRGDRGAAMLRVVGNANRGDYDVIERLPEMRAFGHALYRGLWVEGAATATAFRHSHPYESGVVALLERRNPTAHPESLFRSEIALSAKRPMPVGLGWTLTPYTEVTLLNWSEDTSEDRTKYRVLPAIGITLSNFYRFGRYQVRPVIDFSDRSIDGSPVGRTAIIEHTDQQRDQRPLKLILDQGVGSRLRIRLDGGYDFDRVSNEKWLPTTAKVVALFGAALDFDGELTYDGNNRTVSQARAEFRHTGRILKSSATYHRRRPGAGVPNAENAGGTVEANLGRHWSALIGASYDVERKRLDYARYGITRLFHDFIVTVEVVDQRLNDRLDFKLSGELRLP